MTHAGPKPGGDSAAAAGKCASTTADSEFSFYEILDIIRGRPGMFIEPTLGHLRMFLSGYAMAMARCGATDASQPEFASGFHHWVAQRLGFRESTAGWANMILATTMGLEPKGIRWEQYDRDVTPAQQLRALQTFFELLDEYRYVEHT